MARPQKTGLDYFSHDVDASNDEKIEAMEALYGAAGYCFYFKLLERIYRGGGELIVSDAETRQILARKCLCSVEEWTKMLATALKVGLFDSKIYNASFVLTSRGISDRCNFVKKKRENMANKYQKRVSAAETPPETRQKPDKVKESKVKNTKEYLAIFDLARKAFPGSKRGLEPEWDGFSKKNPKYDDILPLLLPAIEREMDYRKRQSQAGGFVPQWANFSTWINQSRWTQEFGEVETANNRNSNRPTETMLQPDFIVSRSQP